ncbi:hypothetical protein [Brevibacterium moorei]|uniref:hypothetical protein n=1 Tax=Brevibacterium moorei TaxID=2968457 RepID=UPI00211C7D70|nr:hypothetical protein [Brevibacterium sp. 68QC2CO]MCQ9385098.1 hypothetical protein [Brevibacterium sp. 68QC2CO]
MTSDKETTFVGVAGLKGSGKTTFGKILADKIHVPVMHLADPIKKIVRDANPGSSQGLLLSSCDDDLEAKRLHDRYRPSLIAVGEGIREYCPDFWVQCLIHDAEGADIVIVPDVRLPVEAGLMDVIVYVERPGVVSDGSDTERDMSRYASMTVYNDGTLRDLERKAAEVINELGLKERVVF